MFRDNVDFIKIAPFKIISPIYLVFFERGQYRNIQVY